MQVRPIDPRDIAQHISKSTYRVYFFERMAPTSGDPNEADGLVSEEYELSDADVPEVIKWAEGQVGLQRTYVIYLVVQQDGAKSLARLVGVDLTLVPLP